MNSINHFLELIANEVKALLGVVCNERMHLDDQVCVRRERRRKGGREEEEGVQSGRREKGERKRGGYRKGRGMSLGIMFTADCKSLATKPAEQWKTTIDLPRMNLIIFPTSASPTYLSVQAQ